MLMVCQNCGSTDIATIQGQNYCINCGQQVVETAQPAKSAPKSAPGVDSKPEPPHPSQPVAIKAVASVINHAKPHKVDPAPIATVPKRPVSPPPEVVRASKPKVVMPLSMADVKLARPSAPVLTQTKVDHTPKPKPEPAKTYLPAEHVLDLRQAESKPTATAVPSPSPKPATVAKTTGPAKSAKSEAAPPSVPALRATTVAQAFKNALAAIWYREFWPFGLLVAALLALPTAALAYTSASNLAQQWSNLTASSGWWHSLNSFSQLNLGSWAGSNLNLAAAAVLSYLALSGAIKNYAAGAIIFGSARITDHRNATTRQWSLVGLDSMWSNFGVDILYLALILVLLSAGALGVHYLTGSQLTSQAQWLVGGLAGLVLAFLLAGLTIGRSLARNAVVLADFTGPAALRWGFGQYFKRFFKLAVAGILGLVVNLIALAAYGVLSEAIVIRGGLWSNQTTAGIALAGLYLFGSMVLFALTLTFNFSYWHGVYRSLVTQQSSLAIRMLANRQPKPASKAALVAIGLLVLAVTGLISWLIWRH